VIGDSTKSDLVLLAKVSSLLVVEDLTPSIGDSAEYDYFCRVQCTVGLRSVGDRAESASLL
jgi:hypothetical protein